MVTDAEVVTLAVAHVLLGFHDSDRRFLAAARRRLRHLFPVIPTQDAFDKRRARLEASIQWRKMAPSGVGADVVGDVALKLRELRDDRRA
jgi:hypothetical protein